MEFTAKVKSITKTTKETADDEIRTYMIELLQEGCENPRKIKIIEPEFESPSLHVGDIIKIKMVEEQKTLTLGTDK